MSLLSTRSVGLPGDVAAIPIHLDPLLVLAGGLAARIFVTGTALALLTIGLTLLFGRAWCGWICPVGTVLDVVPSRPAARVRVSERWRGIKFVLFVVIVAAAVLGNLTLLFLDPITIFFRTLGTAIWPVVDQIVTALESLVSQIPGMDGPTSAFDQAIRPELLPGAPLSYQDGLFFAGFFVGIAALNALAPRFWCRYLCPLGGMLGLISRVAVFRRRVAPTCSVCGICSEECPTGTIDPARGYQSDPAECTVCMNCVVSCPGREVAFKSQFSLPESRPYDPTRRQALLAIGGAVVGVALFQSDLLAKRESPFLLRPPGAREMDPDPVALTSCTRCGACVRACPTGGLQPAVFQAGLQGLGTPVLVPRLGYCDYSCNACGQVCPTQTIPPLAIPDKQQQVIGKAYIDQNRCLAWSDHVACLVCQEMCPLPDKAIQLEPQTVWAPGGGTVTVPMPHVVRDACIGCGLCEYRCPVSGDAAIRVYIPSLPTPA